MSRLQGVTDRKVRERFSTLRFESTPVERESTPMVGRSTPKKARVDSQWYTRENSEKQFLDTEIRVDSHKVRVDSKDSATPRQKTVFSSLRGESTPRQFESTPRQRDPKNAEDQFSGSESRVDSKRIRVDSRKKIRKYVLWIHGMSRLRRCQVSSRCWRVDSGLRRVDSQSRMHNNSNLEQWPSRLQ